jgi:hypothetical protein
MCCTLSSWERPGRTDGPGAFLNKKKIETGTQTTLRDSSIYLVVMNPTTRIFKRPGRISASPERILSGLSGTKGGTQHPAVL